MSSSGRTFKNRLKGIFPLSRKSPTRQLTNLNPTRNYNPNFVFPRPAATENTPEFCKRTANEITALGTQLKGNLKNAGLTNEKINALARITTARVSGRNANEANKAVLRPSSNLFTTPTNSPAIARASGKDTVTNTNSTNSRVVDKLQSLISSYLKNPSYASQNTYTIMKYLRDIKQKLIDFNTELMSNKTSEEINQIIKDIIESGLLDSKNVIAPLKNLNNAELNTLITRIERLCDSITKKIDTSPKLEFNRLRGINVEGLQNNVQNKLKSLIITKKKELENYIKELNRLVGSKNITGVQNFGTKIIEDEEMHNAISQLQDVNKERVSQELRADIDTIIETYNKLMSDLEQAPTLLGGRRNSRKHRKASRKNHKSSRKTVRSANRKSRRNRG